MDNKNNYISSFNNLSVIDQTLTKKQQKYKQFLVDYFVASVSAIISKTIVSPIDVIKLKQNEGITVFWKGNLNKVLRYFPTQALNFAFNDYFKKIFNKQKGIHTPNIIYFLSGGIAGICSLTLLYSYENIKIKLIHDKRNFSKTRVKKSYGIFNAYKKILIKDGIPGLYKNFVITCINTFIYQSLYFGLFETINGRLFQTFQNNLFIRLCIAWFTTFVSCVLACPIDRVRSQMMMMKDVLKYNNSLDCARVIFNKQGFKSFFYGYHNCIFKSIPGALLLCIYNQIQ